MWPEYPGGFVEGWEATQALLKDVESFQTIPSHMFASGYSRDIASGISRQLRALAATFETVAVERPDEVPLFEKRLMKMRDLERFLDERTWAVTCELRETPAQQDDGEWVADVVLNGNAKRFRYGEKVKQWFG